MRTNCPPGFRCPPLRKALQILEQEYLLMSIPRKGRYKAPIHETNRDKIYEAQRMIE